MIVVIVVVIGQAVVVCRRQWVRGGKERVYSSNTFIESSKRLSCQIVHQPSELHAMRQVENYKSWDTNFLPVYIYLSSSSTPLHKSLPNAYQRHWVLPTAILCRDLINPSFF